MQRLQTAARCANFGVPRSLCLMMWAAIFAVSGSGNRIKARSLTRGAWGVNEPAPFVTVNRRAADVWIYAKTFPHLQPTAK